MISLKKTEPTVINTADFQKAADHLKTSLDLGGNSKKAVSEAVTLAYCEVIAQVVKLPNLAKRSNDRVAVRKALESFFDKSGKAKAKRLAENSINFVLKASNDKELETLFLEAHDGNIPGMAYFMSENDLTEAAMVRYVKGEDDRSPAEKQIDRWKKMIRDDAEEGRIKVAEQAEKLVMPLVAWLQVEGFIEDND